jgi:hypothetical protein
VPLKTVTKCRCGFEDAVTWREDGWDYIRCPGCNMLGSYRVDAALKARDVAVANRIAETDRCAALEGRLAAAESRSAALTEALRGLAEAARTALGTMQKPMERMVKVCGMGLVEPACDHDSLRALAKAMGVLDDAHAAALRALLGAGDAGGER